MLPLLDDGECEVVDVICEARAAAACAAGRRIDNSPHCLDRFPHRKLVGVLECHDVQGAAAGLRRAQTHCQDSALSVVGTKQSAATVNVVCGITPKAA
jgi:hypothetical protein